jgi:hypothetical protein
MTGKPGSYGPVTITQPTQGAAVSSPVTVAGTCYPANSTVAVTVSQGGQAVASSVATAAGGHTTWSSGGFALASGSGYTAVAKNLAAPKSPDSKDFSVRAAAAAGLTPFAGVTITQPGMAMSAPRPVTISGTCSPNDSTIGVTITQGGSSVTAQTVTAKGSVWISGGFSQNLMQGLTTAVACNPPGSTQCESKTFTVR